MDMGNGWHALILLAVVLAVIVGIIIAVVKNQKSGHIPNNRHFTQPDSAAAFSAGTEKRFCTNCGNQLSSGEIFCVRCGTKVG